MNRRQRLGVGFLVLVAASPARAAEELPFMEHARIDPGRVMTAEACGECHIRAYEVWKGTPHATGFKTLHRKEQAETIARKLGFRLIKRDSLCFSCHYTPTIDDGEIRVVSGVSCESCHGAAAKWIDIHSDYGADRKHDAETAEHRRQRIARSREAGMRRPSDLYPVVANCFSCHSVPNERLVNVGGHTTGSAGFEFVEWQEKIRHNFLDSLRSGTFGPNAERPLGRKRLMYVVGRALDLEYSVRGMAVAREEGIYAKAMSRRVRSALAELAAAHRAAPLDPIEAMLSAVREARVVPSNEAALLAVADRIGAATRRLLSAERTLETAALDPLLLGLGEPEPVAPEAGVVAELGAETGGDSATEPGTAAPSGRPAGERPASPGNAAATGIVGALKTRVRAASRHRTLGPASCSGCHTAQNEWWFGDPHYRSADPFFEAAPENQRIARLYGVNPAEMTRGRHVCMDCHGTIVSGKEARDVLDGVSCESCHGAAADWLEAHKVETDKHLGQQRPGHLAALERGKLRLRDPAVRAGMCAGCHYITEPRLLSAGHPSGSDFDYVGGTAQTRHWAHGPAPAAELASAWGAARAERGPVPQVERAVLAASGPEPGVDDAPRRRGGAAAARGAFADPRSADVAALAPPPPRPVPISTATSGGGAQLPPFPDIDSTTSIADALLLLRDRLRLLYRITAPSASGESP